jgi:long-subunit acyl-CoA synthetase (AMP-forming)
MLFFRPEFIENVLLESRFVKSIWVHASSLQSFVVAVVVPDFEELILENGDPSLKVGNFQEFSDWNFPEKNKKRIVDNAKIERYCSQVFL